MYSQFGAYKQKRGTRGHGHCKILCLVNEDGQTDRQQIPLRDLKSKESPNGGQ